MKLTFSLEVSRGEESPEEDNLPEKYLVQVIVVLLTVSESNVRVVMSTREAATVEL